LKHAVTVVQTGLELEVLLSHSLPSAGIIIIFIKIAVNLDEKYPWDGCVCVFFFLGTVVYLKYRALAYQV
jgi:hypothetical protein